MAQDRHYIEMRENLRRMRNFKNDIIEDYSKKPKIKEVKKELTTRDLLGKMRKLNEDNYQPEITTSMDMRQEEDRMKNFFADNNVDIRFTVLDVFDDRVFAGGTIGQDIQWVFKVAPSEEKSGVKIKYLESFDPNNPDNKEILEKIESYYDTFYKYWRDNILN